MPKTKNNNMENDPVKEEDRSWVIRDSNDELKEIGIILYRTITNYIQIDAFAVRAQYRNSSKKYGRSLLNKVIESAKLDGISCIKVSPCYEDYFYENIPLDAETLYKIYQRLGFKFDKEDYNINKWGEKMTLTIP